MTKIIEGVHKQDLDLSQPVLVVPYLQEQPIDDWLDMRGTIVVIVSLTTNVTTG